MRKALSAAGAVRVQEPHPHTEPDAGTSLGSHQRPT
jgi:hypothetical protein